jgi:hypothetical protein
MDTPGEKMIMHAGIVRMMHGELFEMDGIEDRS